MTLFRTLTLGLQKTILMNNLLQNIYEKAKKYTFYDTSKVNECIKLSSKDNSKHYLFMTGESYTQYYPHMAGMVRDRRINLSSYHVLI